MSKYPPIYLRYIHKIEIFSSLVRSTTKVYKKCHYEEKNIPLFFKNFSKAKCYNS